MGIFIILCLACGTMFYLGTLQESRRTLATRQTHVRARVREVSLEDLGRATLMETLSMGIPEPGALEFLEKVLARTDAEDV